MRMKYADEFKSVGFNPLKGVQLLVWIHDESGRAFCLIRHGDHFLNPVIFSGKKSACLEWDLRLRVVLDLLPLACSQDEP